MPYLSDFKRQESKKHRTARRQTTNWAEPQRDLVQITKAEDWYYFLFDYREYITIVLNIENYMSIVFETDSWKGVLPIIDFIHTKQNGIDGSMLNSGQPRSCNCPCLSLCFIRKIQIICKYLPINSYVASLVKNCRALADNYKTRTDNNTNNCPPQNKTVMKFVTHLNKIYVRLIKPKEGSAQAPYPLRTLSTQHISV